MSLTHEQRRRARIERAARWVLTALFIIAIGAFFAFDLQSYTTLETLQANEQIVVSYAEYHPVRTMAIYFTITVLCIVFALPAAALMMMLSGAIFGVTTGVIVCSCSITAGAILSFLSARFLFADFISRRFKRQAAFVNRGIEKEGVLFLVTMRLLPMMPFFVTNLLLGVTKMPLKKFWLASQLSSLPSVILFAHAGKALSTIRTFQDVLSPRLFISLTLLACFPTIARLFMRKIKNDGFRP